MFESQSVRPSRRQFLQTTALATTSLLAANSFGAEEGGEWIDAHSHVWTPDVSRYPLANGHTIADLAPPSFSAEELIDLAKQSGVNRVVLIQHHPYHGWDNSYLLDTAKQYPETFRIVAQIDDRGAQPSHLMRELAKQKVTGFRITPSTMPPGSDEATWLSGAGMHSMWKTAAETRQNICCLLNPHHLMQVDAMCKTHPETPVVIDHFARIGIDGNIKAADVAALCNLAKHPHVRVKASAYYALGAKAPPHRELLPLLRQVLDAFGRERVMWASDSPYQLSKPNSYAASLAFIHKEADFLDAKDREWLLRRTAEATFFFA